jgi:hypothetical protein
MRDSFTFLVGFSSKFTRSLAMVNWAALRNPPSGNQMRLVVRVAQGFNLLQPLHGFGGFERVVIGCRVGFMPMFLMLFSPEEQVISLPFKIG